MQHEFGSASLPKTWLKNARADLAIARIQLPEEGMYEHLCFHAQQAVEKSIKALLLYLNIDFPFTYDIGSLISLLPSEIQHDPVISEAVILTPYAVITRYPGEIEPITEDKHSEAL